MIKLIQNIDIYAPEHLGKKDVLIIHDKIVKIADAGSLSIPSYFPESEQIDGTNLILTPGFIDCHVHVLGGGGEGGFANRTPEATMEGLTKFGVTTVVGCLGTDGIGRDMCALVAKTKGLNEQGISAYCYTGSYQVPVRTLTDSIPKDIMMIQEIIGTGEIAISDHRSSQPTFEEFTRVAADTRLGGVLSGKAGIINVHLGDGSRGMELINRVIDETEIPASQFLPTHVNRNEALFCQAIEYALKGGAVDFTGNEDIDYWETICDEVRVCKGIKRMLNAGVNPNRITISSDGQGSLPIYNKKGEFQGMGVGQSSCLLKEVKGENEAVLFARSATAGSQKFPVHWGGDCSANYPSMAETLRGGHGLSGPVAGVLAQAGKGVEHGGLSHIGHSGKGNNRLFPLGQLRRQFGR